MGEVSSREERKTNTWLLALTPAAPSSLPDIVMLEPVVETTSQTQEVISVVLKVPSVSPQYINSISVPAGSSLEDVLKKAQKFRGFT